MKSTEKVGIHQFEGKKTGRDVTEVTKGSESGEIESIPKPRARGSQWQW